METPHSPSRPERSSARLSGTGHSTENSTEGHGGAFGGVTAAASNGVVNAYTCAPDLGISSTANNAYQRAPDLGVGATISRYLGQGEANNSANATSPTRSGPNYRKEPQENYNDEYEHDRVIRPGEKKEQQQQGEKGNGGGSETRRQESERLGPSDQSRVGKTQMQIGTETGIPTAAGAGSTASADKSNVKALEKAESKGNVHQANVPEDYEASYCPTDNAGTGKSDHVTDSSHNTTLQSNDPHRETHEKKGKSSSGHSNRSSGSHDQTTTSEKRHSHKSQTVKTSDGNELEMEKRRSLGSKLKDQIKGEMKILAGTVTGNDEKIIKGMHIKEGDHE